MNQDRNIPDNNALEAPRPLPDEIACISKSGISSLNGDRIFASAAYKAVFDGATPKGSMLWDGVPGDVHVAELLCHAMDTIAPGTDAQTAIIALNEAIAATYQKHSITFEEMKPEERLQASAVIFSQQRCQVWVFGDCTVKINDRIYKHTRSGDKLLADLRAFYTEAISIRGESTDLEDPGRTAILPFLKLFPCMANQDGEFAYDALNGGPIHADHVIIYPVTRGDRIILASDGYPDLLDTLAETEKRLFDLLEEDPTCTGKLRGTKGVRTSGQSFDDRSYVSFYVE